MATNENGTSGSSDPMDLDRLIGDLETEAARRRAEPGYPHDADAQLHFELARRAPSPPDATPLNETIAKIEEVAFSDADAPPTVEPGSGRARRHDHAAVHDHLRRLDARMTSSALAAAAALRALTDRLEQLEDSVRHLGPPDPGVALPLPPDEFDVITPWRAQLADALAPGTRVLYAQARADEVVADLRAAGIDAYGITSSGSPYRPGPDVGSGELLTHLGAVPDDALGAVVLAGVPDVMNARAIGPLVSELSRSVVVISEAPWSWRLRLGAVNADLAPYRPLDPDTWLHAFHGVDMVGSAQYDPTGQSYRVVVRARE
jgi:hypothetical protein